MPLRFQALQAALPALHCTALITLRCVQVAELLLKAGANVNAKSSGDGWIPIHAAAWVGLSTAQFPGRSPCC